MIKHIEVSSEEMEEIISRMPENLKEKLLSLIRPDSGIDVLKSFVDQYEDHNMLDHILAHTASTLIKRITTIAGALHRDKKKKFGESLTTIDVTMIVIEALKEEAKQIKKAVDDHEKNCPNGDNCGATH